MTLPGIACISWSRCEPCMYGLGDNCFDPPRWHSWAGPEDVAHALATGQRDPSGSRCGCACAIPRCPVCGTLAPDPMPPGWTLVNDEAHCPEHVPETPVDGDPTDRSTA